MTDELDGLRRHLTETMGRITAFWGFGKVMGQLYGVLFLSPVPLGLSDMADALAISKANVSINIRNLEQWGMARRVWVKGDRKDFYEAETDFWKIVQGVLRAREKKEFDQALSSLAIMMEEALQVQRSTKSQDSAFVVERLRSLQGFVKSMDRLVTLVLALENLSGTIPGLSKRK